MVFNNYNSSDVDEVYPYKIARLSSLLDLTKDEGGHEYKDMKSSHTSNTSPSVSRLPTTPVTPPSVSIETPLLPEPTISVATDLRIMSSGISPSPSDVSFPSSMGSNEYWNVTHLPIERKFIRTPSPQQAASIPPPPLFPVPISPSTPFSSNELITNSIEHFYRPGYSIPHNQSYQNPHESIDKHFHHVFNQHSFLPVNNIDRTITSPNASINLNSSYPHHPSHHHFHHHHHHPHQPHTT